MYTEQLTQRYGFAAPIAPQQLTTTTTLTTGSVDLQTFHKALFLLETGAFDGTAPTLSAAVTVQDSPDGTTWSTNANVAPPPATVASKQYTVEVRADQLNAGARFVRLSIVFTIGGTSPTIPVACMGWGDEAAHKPGSAKNDASVSTQTVVN
jgi:hypothetical protein